MIKSTVQERKAELTRQLGIDLDYVSESVAQVITSVTNISSEMQMRRVSQLRRTPAGFDPELIEAWHCLNDIIDDLFKGDRTSNHDKSGKLREFVSQCTSQRVATRRDYS